MFSFDRIQSNHPKNIFMLMSSVTAGDLGDDSPHGSPTTQQSAECTVGLFSQLLRQ